MQPRVSRPIGPFCTLAVLGPCLLAGCGGPLPVTGGDAGPGPGDAGPGWTPDAAESPVDAAPTAVDAASPPDAGEPPAPSDPELEACWPGHTCWLEGADVIGMDGADAGSIHVFDRAGRVFRQEGPAWVEIPGIRERRVRRLHVASRDELFAVTEHRDAAGFFVDRFDGIAWTTIFSDADGTFLTGFGSDNVWTRATGGALHRWDGASWSRAPEFDARYGELALEVVQSRHEPMLLAGPAPTAYAIIEGAVAVVMRFDGRFWSNMGALSSGWSSLGWADGAIRAIELHGSGSGEDAVMLEHDGVRWLPIGHAPPGRYLVGSNRGVFASAGDPRCRIEFHSGAVTYCADEGRLLIVREGLEGPWGETRLPDPARPFSPELWGEVPPAYWAPGAAAAVGAGPSAYVRLRRADVFVGTGQRYVDDVIDGVPSQMAREDGEALLGTQLDANDAGELFVLLDDWGLHRRAPGSARVERLVTPHHAFSTARIAAASDGVWMVRGAQVLRARGTTVSVDAELPWSTFEDEVDLADVCVLGEDVWVLGTVGHRSRDGRLWHRELSATGEVSYRAVALPRGFWGGAQLERRGDVLYVTGLGARTPVVRIPIERLVGDALEAELDELAIGDGPLPGVFEEPLADPELWLGARGPWLITESRVAWIVE